MSYKILMAEDDQMLYNILSRNIKRKIERIEITHAANGVRMMGELDKIIRGECEYDLIISDNDMGAVSGLQCLERAQRLGINTPYVIMSGNDISEAALAAGATKFIKKPFTHRALLDLVRGYMPNLNKDTE
ncbi:response regulator [archaeon]|nr:response regulator [archaeon]